MTFPNEIKANILLVDDRPENLLVLQAILAPLDQNLVIARSGAEALKHLLHEEYAVILLDVQMPEMDGFETAALIRQRAKTSYLPIIFITALGNDQQSISQAYQSGAVDYIYKPFDPTVLRSKVSVFVDMHRQNLEIQRQAELLRQSELREMQRKHEEQEFARSLESARQLEMRQQVFLQEVLASVTGGKLQLCYSHSELPKRLRPASKNVILTAETLAHLRTGVRDAAESAAMPTDRASDLLTAVSEAAMNAVVHAGGGCGRIFVSDGGKTIQAWIEDEGKGITLHHLPRATLERGFTTAGTLGHGFWLMLQMIDRLWLMSGPSGTTVVLEQDHSPAEPSWQA